MNKKQLNCLNKVLYMSDYKNRKRQYLKPISKKNECAFLSELRELIAEKEHTRWSAEAYFRALAHTAKQWEKE